MGEFFNSPSLHGCLFKWTDDGGWVSIKCSSQQQAERVAFSAAGRRRDPAHLHIYSSKRSLKGITETQTLLRINVLPTKHVYLLTSALCKCDGVIYRPLGLAIVFRFQWTHEGTFMPPASVWVGGGWGWRRHGELRLLPRAELSCHPCRSVQRRRPAKRLMAARQRNTTTYCCNMLPYMFFFSLQPGRLANSNPGSAADSQVQKPS